MPEETTDSMDTRVLDSLDKLNNKVDGISASIAKIGERVSTIETLHANQATTTTEIKSKVETLDGRLREVEINGSTVTRNNKDIATKLETRVTALEGKDSRYALALSIAGAVGAAIMAVALRFLFH